MNLLKTAFNPNLVDVSSVGMEIATAIRVFRQTDRQTDDGQNVVRKVHANIETGPLPSKIVSVVRQTLASYWYRKKLSVYMYIHIHELGIFMQIVDSKVSS